MAGHELIDAYLARLARRLPTDTVDEIADGLHEAYERELASAPAGPAATAAISEFGPADELADAFVRTARGRLIARHLLATGPLVGLCWATSLVATRAWLWLPRVLPMVVVAALATVVIGLVAAATTKHHYGRTRLGLAAALLLVAIDATMVGGVAALAPVLVWPLAVAIPASLTRICLTLNALRPGRIAW